MALLETLAGEPERTLTLCRECLPILEMAGLKREALDARRTPRSTQAATERVGGYRRCLCAGSFSAAGGLTDSSRS